MNLKIMTWIVSALLIAVAPKGFADDTAPQSKSEIEKDGTSEPPGRTHVVGVTPITNGTAPQSSGEVDSGNSSSMGMGIQFDLSKPKTAVAPAPNPSIIPRDVSPEK